MTNMASDMPLKERINEHIPEGLTGILSLGGTRTAYVLEKGRYQDDPGKIEQFEDYASWALAKMFDIIEMFFELGGANLMIAHLAIQRFSERSERYIKGVVDGSMLMIDKNAQVFYRKNRINPYFAGIDTLLHLPSDTLAHSLGVAFHDFQANWELIPDGRKLVWEVAPIPLFSFWRAPVVLGDEQSAALAEAIAKETNLERLYERLYDYYSLAAYGVEFPMPHFYLGSNRNRDLKLRALLPFTLDIMGPMRLYYLPYPSLFMKRVGFERILEDLLQDKRFRVVDNDYRGTMSQADAQHLYDYFQMLSEDIDSTVGLAESVLERVRKGLSIE